MRALLAAYAGKPSAQVPAFQKLFDDLLDHRPEKSVFPLLAMSIMSPEIFKVMEDALP